MEDFSSCCAGTTFANEMARASPFSSLEHAIIVARDIWSRKLNVRFWLEAISGRSCSNEYLEMANEATVQIASKEELKYIERAIRELLSKKSVQTTDEGDVSAEYSGKIVADTLDGADTDSEDDLDDISSGRYDIARNVELDNVPKKDNETLNIQHREDDVHAAKGVSI
ncbi:hypothetical protein Ahy_B07g088427 [Arachis hypogaea]|uniref:Oxo-4-hydroxy-4-carboxy-5-ureidoimidazoline decarboxylase domain-containing protein n=1 Tax=Arachis hypogaea TaxID=3818 RepID=A0A444YEF7_ARAHY|nr:hypothetical protein Ahy_B07g088427 [Arachis hypogaea]